MMARNTNVPFKGRIQKRKTHHLQIITFGLQRAAGPYRSYRLSRRSYVPLDVRLDPKAIKALLCSEMTRWAISRPSTGQALRAGIVNWKRVPCG
jgi:hypothetical protein